jgi:hypothetical protein
MGHHCVHRHFRVSHLVHKSPHKSLGCLTWDYRPGVSEKKIVPVIKAE